MKKSISKQFAIIYILLLAVTIGACLLMNAFFAQRYYQRHKEQSIVKAYSRLNELLQEMDPESEDFQVVFDQICGRNNINTLIVDSSFRIVESSMGEDERVIRRLASYIFADDPNFEPEMMDAGGPGVSGDGVPADGPGASGENAPKKPSPSTTELIRTKDYVVMRSNDPWVSSDYLELWGTFSNGDMVLMRSPVESIVESANVSNHFLVYVGLISLLFGAVIVWQVSKRITKPILELTNISAEMTALHFEAKYEGDSQNEIGVLGSHMNVLSETLEKTISELKTANNELQGDLEQRKKMDAMRHEFISSVSHELKTPIALIQGYAEGLRDGVTDDPESMQFYCDVIVDEADKMNKMVQNLLTLNHLEFGDQEMTMERFDIMEMIHAMVKSSDILIRQANAEVSIEGDAPLFVWGDELRVEEVFGNYLSNAIHYVNDNGRITIRTAVNGSVARISVINTGSHIPEDSLDKVWGEFYKVDKARTREYGGTGVGLSIVKAVMDSFHKDYGVNNLEDGVEFWFELDCK